MTSEQESHLSDIIGEFGALTDKKYRAGQSEHGGNLWDVPLDKLVDNAIDEAIDQVVYLLTIKRQLQVRLVTVGDTLRINSPRRYRALDEISTFGSATQLAEHIISKLPTVGGPAVAPPVAPAVQSDMPPRLAWLWNGAADFCDCTRRERDPKWTPDNRRRLFGSDVSAVRGCETCGGTGMLNR